MARRRKSKKSETLALGFFGTKKTTKKNIYSLLDDHIEAQGGDPKFFVVSLEDYWEKVNDWVLDYAEDNKVPVIFVHDGSAPEEDLEWADDEIEVVDHAELADALAEILTEEDGKLLLFWEDEETHWEFYDAAQEAKVPCLDLADGLAVLEDTEVPDEEDLDDDVETVSSDEDEDPGAAELADPDRVWEEEELAELDNADLKIVAEVKGVEVKKGKWSKTYIAEILEAQDVGDEDPETGGEPTTSSGSDDAEEAEEAAEPAETVSDAPGEAEDGSPVSAPSETPKRARKGTPDAVEAQVSELRSVGGLLHVEVTVGIDAAVLGPDKTIELLEKLRDL